MTTLKSIEITDKGHKFTVEANGNKSTALFGQIPKQLYQLINDIDQHTKTLFQPVSSSLIGYTIKEGKESVILKITLNQVIGTEYAISKYEIENFKADIVIYDGQTNLSITQAIKKQTFINIFIAIHLDIQTFLEENYSKMLDTESTQIEMFEQP
ncbi:MAG: hypothetical protein EAZ32_06210 [Cytophagia bacterium]|nr:MAG: hypothetical protein EAZ32_06210 [Cytophagia bacterium]